MLPQDGIVLLNCYWATTMESRLTSGPLDAFWES